MVRIGAPAGPRRGINLPGYAPVYLNWTLITTSTQANQTIGNYTITQGKILKIQAIIVEVYFTTLSITPALLGTFTIMNDVEDIIGPLQASNTSSGALFGLVVPIPDEGIELVGDTYVTIGARCSPAVATSIAWRVTILGFKRD